MCFSVQQRSLEVGVESAVDICCDHHDAHPDGFWEFMDRNGNTLTEGLFPDSTSPQPTYGFCVSIRVTPPKKATEFRLTGSCINPLGDPVCVQIVIIPVYLQIASALSDSSLSSPKNIPEPFRRKDAPEEIANNSLNWE